MRKIDTPAELLRLLADSSPGLIALLDRGLGYRYLNQQYRDWFGINPDDYVGKTPADLMSAEDYKVVKPHLDRALRGERTVQEFKISYKFGRPRNVRFYITPHRSPKGEVLGLCVLVLDITEDLRVRETLEEATRAKSRFLAAASHDLRQPLHALTLLTHALRRRTSGLPEASEMLDHMSKALTSLRRMFEALLDVSKLDAGLMKPEVRVFALEPVLGALCETFATRADTRELRFSLQAIDAYVHTDQAVLEMTLSNLIANAIKFTVTGGVLVGCRRRNGKIRIEVYDTGCGIPEDQIEAVFEEFEHNRSTARGPNDGIGLGLSLVRRYCDLMGYELDVRSKPGKGSRFSIALPEISKDAFASAPRSKAAAARDSLEGTRLLVLDDEPHVAYALSRDLADQGADVVTAERLEDAEAILASGDWPDAAIIDYDLGCEEMGDSFIARMESAANQSLPSLILTGSTDRESLRALAASGRRWLTKPVDPEVLSAAIVGLVDS
ncbi:MAG: ATP-binding protein [Pseudomonadota bacterium]|nr:ATP-binding protein [Pseudomonadota bacterium]